MKKIQQPSDNNPRIRENPMNAASYLDSERHGQYDMATALADIIDNSLDAAATEVKVFFSQQKGKLFLYIADNGKGIHPDNMMNALNMSSKSYARGSTDLGKFGRGLCSASLNLGEKLTVVSKTKESGYHSGINDYEMMIAQDKFLFEEGNGTWEEQNFRSILGDSPSGTVVTIQNLISCSKDGILKSITEIKEQLSKIFTKKIEEGFCLKVKVGIGPDQGWDILQPNDPVKIKDEKGKDAFTLLQEFKDLSFTVDKNSFKVGVKIYRLSNELGKDYVKNDDAGFYIYRNNRLIASAQEIETFSKHGDFSHFRGEIHLDPSADLYFGVNHTKRTIVLHDELKKVLRDRNRSVIREALIQHFKSNRPTPPINRKVVKANAIIINAANKLPQLFKKTEVEDLVEKAKRNLKYISNANASESSETERPKLVEAPKPKEKSKSTGTSKSKKLAHPEIEIIEDGETQNPQYPYEYDTDGILTVTFYENHPNYSFIGEDTLSHVVYKAGVLSEISAISQMPEDVDLTKKEWHNLYKQYYTQASQLLINQIMKDEAQGKGNKATKVATAA